MTRKEKRLTLIGVLMLVIVVMATTLFLMNRTTDEVTPPMPEPTTTPKPMSEHTTGLTPEPTSEPTREIVAEPTHESDASEFEPSVRPTILPNGDIQANSDEEARGLLSGKTEDEILAYSIRTLEPDGGSAHLMVRPFDKLICPVHELAKGGCSSVLHVRRAEGRLLLLNSEDQATVNESTDIGDTISDEAFRAGAYCPEHHSVRRAWTLQGVVYPAREMIKLETGKYEEREKSEGTINTKGEAGLCMAAWLVRVEPKVYQIRLAVCDCPVPEQLNFTEKPSGGNGGSTTTQKPPKPTATPNPEHESNPTQAPSKGPDSEQNPDHENPPTTQPPNKGQADPDDSQLGAGASSSGSSTGTAEHDEAPTTAAPAKKTDDSSGASSTAEQSAAPAVAPAKKTDDSSGASSTAEQSAAPVEAPPKANSGSDDPVGLGGETF